MVRELLEVYNLIRAHVLTAYGLSAWYQQVGGIIQGGGLDPLFYVIYTCPLHRAIMVKKLGVVVQGYQETHTIGTAGLVDDTVIMGHTVEETQYCLERVRGVIHLAGQRCNVDKFQSLHLVKQGSKVEAHRSVLQWGGQEVNTVRE